jgi:hypothetical protein
VRNEFIPAGFSDEFFKVIEEMEALKKSDGGYYALSLSSTHFLIWNAAKCIVGVFSFQIDNELSKLMISTIEVHRVLCDYISSECM